MFVSERLVKEKFPKARCETYKKRGFGETYFLVRDGNSVMYLSEGKTKKEAWDNASIKLANINFDNN